MNSRMELEAKRLEQRNNLRINGCMTYLPQYMAHIRKCDWGPFSRAKQ